MMVRKTKLLWTWKWPLLSITRKCVAWPLEWLTNHAFDMVGFFLCRCVVAVISICDHNLHG